MAARPHRPPPRAPRPTPAAAPAPRALDERELEALQTLLEAVPAPLEPLDVSMLDGFLCAVLVQPAPPPASRWLPFVTDIEGRPLPPGFDAAPLHALVLRRHAELAAAIAARRWFDPWVFEPDADGGEGIDADAPADDDEASVRAAVYPWVAGFATAFETFPALSQAPDDELLEPLALLYRHLDPDDIEEGEDGQALREAIEAEEPAADLADAVEGLVRATLLLADVAGRPGPAPSAPSGRAPRGSRRR
jgi:uncharacterized protein